MFRIVTSRFVCVYTHILLEYMNDSNEHSYWNSSRKKVKQVVYTKDIGQKKNRQQNEILNKARMGMVEKNAMEKSVVSRKKL